ncbi:MULTISPECIES: hypothetical protein [Pantoea]|uniref:Transmembrane anchored protein n=1 Tax=Candidatus Pantoea multigeneris TaxID=2608357 RepID=A0ABX0RCR6_9GAMM|nr:MULTISPECIES: hypothetical protein [Pantoea]NIF23151.1 hypothetical protein [Pantoea multigeneris]
MKRSILMMLAVLVIMPFTTQAHAQLAGGLHPQQNNCQAQEIFGDARYGGDGGAAAGCDGTVN